MAFEKWGPALAVVVGALVALSLVYLIFSSTAVTISGIRVNFVGPGPGQSASNMGTEFVAPTDRTEPVPSLPFNVAKGQNLTVAWTLWIDSSSSNSTFNVTSVAVSSPFVLTAMSPGFLWNHIPSGTPILEEVTILAPASNGDFVVTVTVTISN